MLSSALRRPLTITTWLVVSVLYLALSPLVVGLAAAAGALTRRPQPLILARLLVAYFVRELGVLAACGALWVLSAGGLAMRSRPLQAAHYRLLRWFVHGVTGAVRRLLEIEVEPRLTAEVSAAMAAERPVLVFSRHAGPGDTLILIEELLCRYDRLPSVVFKDTLAIDPSVDLIGHRLPHAVLDRSDPQECEDRIEKVAAGLRPRGALLLFPEGGNFTPERRRSAIAKLWRKGRRREAQRAEEMEHVLAPHPGGALAALRGNPGADVLFAAHTGLGLAAFPRELWRQAPLKGTLTTRMWLVPAAERPRGADEQVAWIYDWWQRLDEWIDGQGEASEPD